MYSSHQQEGLHHVNWGEHKLSVGSRKELESVGGEEREDESLRQGADKIGAQRQWQPSSYFSNGGKGQVILGAAASVREYYLVFYFTLFLVLVKVYYPLVTVSLVVVMPWERRIGSGETKTGQGACQTEKGKSQRQEFWVGVMGKVKNKENLSTLSLLTQESSEAFRRERKFLWKYISWKLEFFHVVWITVSPHLTLSIGSATLSETTIMQPVLP